MTTHCGDRSNSNGFLGDLEQILNQSVAMLSLCGDQFRAIGLEEFTVFICSIHSQHQIIKKCEAGWLQYSYASLQPADFRWVAMFLAGDRAIMSKLENGATQNRGD